MDALDSKLAESRQRQQKLALLIAEKEQDLLRANASLMNHLDVPHNNNSHNNRSSALQQQPRRQPQLSPFAAASPVPSRSFLAHSQVLNQTSPEATTPTQALEHKSDQGLVLGVQRRMHHLQDQLEDLKHKNCQLSVSDRLWRKEKQKLVEKLAVLDLERSNRTLVEIELRRDLRNAKNELSRTTEDNRQLRVELNEAHAKHEMLGVDLREQRNRLMELETTCVDLERSHVDRTAEGTAIQAENKRLSEEIAQLRLQLSEAQQKADQKRQASLEVLSLKRTIEEYKQEQQQQHDMLGNLRSALQEARDTLSNSDVECRDHLTNLDMLSQQNANLETALSEYKTQVMSYRELAECQQNDIVDLERQKQLMMDTQAMHHRLFAKEIKACVSLVERALLRWDSFPSLTKAEMNRLTNVDESLYELHAVPASSSASNGKLPSFLQTPSSSSSSFAQRHSRVPVSSLASAADPYSSSALRKGLLRVKKVILELFVALSKASDKAS